MNKMTFNGWKRISRPAAKKLWGKKDIVLSPSNFVPFNIWHTELLVEAERIAKLQKSEFEHQRTQAEFEFYVRNFEWYNCVNHETGYYASFYVKG